MHPTPPPAVLRYLCEARDGKKTFDYDWGRHPQIAPWTLHDLRRTVATKLAGLGTPPHVTERLLNHVSGTVSGVAPIYNRHASMGEMRETLDAWERELISITTA